MKRHNRLLLAATIVQIVMLPTALAETDKKIVSGSACQARNPEDRQNLKYMALGVQAVNGDVWIACPIVRDSTRSGVNFVNARYQRGTEFPLPGSVENQFTGQFKGTFYSCSNLAAGDAQCVKKSGGSPGEDGKNGKPGTGNTMEATSVFIDTQNLPHDDERYYAYIGVLPEFAILKSITYQEAVK